LHQDFSRIDRIGRDRFEYFDSSPRVGRQQILIRHLSSRYGASSTRFNANPAARRLGRTAD
jgi:hypothetical protein